MLISSDVSFLHLRYSLHDRPQHLWYNYVTREVAIKSSVGVYTQCEKGFVNSKLID